MSDARLKRVTRQRDVAVAALRKIAEMPPSDVRTAAEDWRYLKRVARDGLSALDKEEQG